MNNDNIISWIMKIGTVVGIIAALIFILVCFKNNIFTSPESMHIYLIQYGFMAPLIFMIIIILCKPFSIFIYSAGLTTIITQIAQYLT